MTRRSTPLSELVELADRNAGTACDQPGGTVIDPVLLVSS
jgi:hypothetical protein